MEWVVIIFLVASIFLYCLLAGADFGAGVLEFFVPPKRREAYMDLTAMAMGPVWEVNHIWLIIMIVILFNGFPNAFSTICTYFHIPLIIMLIGVIIRGCSFSFRHYDAVKDHSQQYYSWAFALSSLVTPVMLGMVIGGLMSGRVDTHASGYSAQYIEPWCDLFSFSVGLFCLCIFSFLASVYLIGEAHELQMKERLMVQARIASLVMVLMGAVVFTCAGLEGLSLGQRVLGNPISLSCLIAASLALFFLWKAIGHENHWYARLSAGFELAMILGAWLAVIFPNILFFKDAKSLSLFSSLAPGRCIDILGISLIGGTLLFAPALGYLFVVFKAGPQKLH